MGLKMPVIFLVHANNSSISTRLAETEEESLQRIVKRFECWGDLMTPGQLTK